MKKGQQVRGVIRRGLTKKVPDRQRPAGRGKRGHVDYWGRVFLVEKTARAKALRQEHV